MDNLKEVIIKNNFGLCPICGKPLLLLKSYYALYTLTNIALAHKLLADIVKYKVKCKDCGYSCEMKLLPGGLVPKNYNSELDAKPILLNNPIGYNREEDINAKSK